MAKGNKKNTKKTKRTYIRKTTTSNKKSEVVFVGSSFSKLKSSFDILILKLNNSVIKKQFIKKLKKKINSKVLNKKLKKLSKKFKKSRRTTEVIVFQFQKKKKKKLTKFVKKTKKLFVKNIKRKLRRTKKQLRKKHRLLLVRAKGSKIRWKRRKKKLIARFKNLLKKKKKRGRPRKVDKVSRERKKILISIVVSVSIITLSWVIYDYIFLDLPSVSELKSKEQIVTTKIYDRHGTLLFRIYKDENRTVVPLSKISRSMINATIAIEDQDFYDHHGFSIKGIIRALIANIKGESIRQGGSTITQQLVKNRLLTPERTIRRKLRELLLSILVDGFYTKDEILEMYFNQVAYGGSIYGVEEAAWRYFNKPAANLSLSESSLLAGLPKAPSVYSPFGSNPETSYARQAEVLRRMVEDKYITQAESSKARVKELVFRQDVIDIKAPHFVMYVKKLLAEKFGEDMLTQGGLEVRTTLDFELQEKAQEIVSAEIDKIRRLKISNGAALMTNPKTGEILAMVGSADYFNFKDDGQVNVTVRPRQPGSSIKPLTYALALERGQSPSTVINDSPITYHTVGSKPYSPKNYDGKYHGKVTLRESLASSYNIPAVKTLAGIGVNTLIDKAEALGIDTWKDRKRFGLSLTLGGGEVTMTDMAELYSSFATQGYSVDLNPFLEIKNYKGEVFYRNDCALDDKECLGDLDLDPTAGYLISDILSDNRARTPAFGPRSFLHIPGQQVAVKTGTTNSLRDNWTIGYTSDRLAAVWVGNNNNTSMSYVASGVTGASPIWNELMRLVLDDEDPHKFATPSGIVRTKICVKTGTLPCRGCPLVREESFVAGMEPKKACNPAVFRPRPTNNPDQDPNRDSLLDGIIITP